MSSEFETELWTGLSSASWGDTLKSDSVFNDLYLDSVQRIMKAIKKGGHDVLLDVGCGTGDIIGRLEGCNIPRIGMDINPDFITTCRDNFGQQEQAPEFHVGNATELVSWWHDSGFAAKYSRPLVICCNNTIMIMPESIRATVIYECKAVAGDQGRALVTFWNGRMFSHGIMGYYKKHPELCGPFDLTPECVNWETRSFKSKTGYTSQWLMEEDVTNYMNSIGVTVEPIERETKDLPDKDHVCESGMGLYVWIFGSSKGNSHKSNGCSA